MPTIDWAMRAICMASRTRQSEGTPRSARYEGRVVTGSVMARVRMRADDRSVPQMAEARARRGAGPKGRGAEAYSPGAGPAPSSLAFVCRPARRRSR